MENILNLSGRELYDKALIYEKNEDYDNSGPYMTMSANYKFPQAVNTIYSNDMYKKQNFKITKKFYKNTMYNDNSFSIHILGYMYKHGYGVKQNINLAILLFNLGMEKGNKYSMINLALLYEIGVYVKKDINYAANLYRRVIENSINDAESMKCIVYTFAIDQLAKCNNQISFKDKLKDASIYLQKNQNINLIKILFDLKKQMILTLIEKNNAEIEINKLRNTIIDLETHIAYSPEGTKFLKIKKEWDKRNKKKKEIK